MSLYADTFTEITERRLPTLRQYLQAKRGKSIPKKFLVLKIWIPNKYPSYSLETEHFRASVGKNTAIGKILKDNWAELLESEKSTMLSIETKDGKATGMRFSPGTGSGMWMDIGTDPLLGISWEW